MLTQVGILAVFRVLLSVAIFEPTFLFSIRLGDPRDVNIDRHAHASGHLCSFQSFAMRSEFRTYVFVFVTFARSPISRG